MSSERAVLASEQEMSQETPASVAVNGDHDVYVFEKIRQGRRMRGVEMGRRDVLSMGDILGDCVKGGPRSARNLPGHRIGRSLKVAAVVGHDPEASAEFAEFGDLFPVQEFLQQMLCPPGLS